MDKEDEPLLVSTSSSKKKTILIIIAFTLAVILAASTIVIAIKLKSKYSDYDNLEIKYNNLNNQYLNQNSSINDVFKCVHDLIANTTMSNTTIKKDDYKDVKKKFELMKNFSDGTYNYITQEEISYKKGYQIGFETESRAYDNYYSDEEYDNIVYKIAAFFGINADIGVYDHKPEISFLIEDIDLAFSLAAIFNQQTIWDWSYSELLSSPLYQDEYY